jgi:hypothetical protein
VHTNRHSPQFESRGICENGLGFQAQSSQTGSQSLLEITIPMRYAELAVPIFDSREILDRTMPAWCLLNAGGHGYRALTSQCRPQQPIEIADSNRLSATGLMCG